MSENAAPFMLGWEEWVALPDLGLPAIRAKIDTGARTSALHAFLVEPFGPIDRPRVRFGIHPLPGRHDIEIYCAAPVVDRREVISSNGDREMRYVIASTLEVGGRQWPIEITLANRETMTYRMLIGRQAIREDVFVDPSASFRQPKLSFKLYRHLPARNIVNRPLRIALVTAATERPGNARLQRAATARGHVLEIIDTAQLALGHTDRPRIECAGAPLAHYDAVLPRISRADGPLAIAAVRELEALGAVSLAPADALVRLADPIAAIQHLAHRKLPVAPPSRQRADRDPVGWGRRRMRPLRRLLVIGREVAGTAEIHHGTLWDASERRIKEDVPLARRAAQAFGLRLAAIDVVADGMGSRAVARVSAAPALATMERITGARTAELIIAEIEALAKSWVRRRDDQIQVDD